MKNLLYILLFVSTLSFAQTTVRMSAVASGTNTYSTTFAPPVSTFNTGTIYVIPFTNANSSGTITVDPDTGGAGSAVSIKGDDGNDLAVGVIKSGGTYAFKFNGTLLRMIGSSGSGGWPLTGTANFTGDVIIDNGVHNLLLGAITGPYSSWDIDGSGPLSLPNSNVDGVGDPTSADHVYVMRAKDGTASQVLLSAAENDGTPTASSFGVSAGTSPNISATTDGVFNIQTAGVSRIAIQADGTWALGVGLDVGTTGKLLSSNGTGTPPTWGLALLTGSATLNFDLTSVNSQDLTITVAGAADGDAVSIGFVNASATANVIYTAWTSATNTVTVRASRIDVATGANPASGTFKAVVIK